MRKEVKTTNRKFDRLEQSVEEFERDNQRLKDENKSMSDRIEEMGRSISRLEHMTSENEEQK